MLKHRQELVSEAISKYPEIAIGLSQDQIKATIPVAGATEHQKEACRLAAKVLNLHPQYVRGYCPANRPTLLPTGKNWIPGAMAWCHEHRISTQQLAAEYVTKMRSERATFDHLYEPFTCHKDGVIMSAHDDNKFRYPVPVAEW